MEPLRLNPEAVDALLPQTQCRRCGYAACRPYAEAMAAGAADINRCPPGGAATVERLAAITGRAPKPIAEDCEQVPQPLVAVVREDECIGCTRCIQACPVDAIVGAAKLMHTVLADECTGCGLCLPACPVDCIDMNEAAPGEGQVRWPPYVDDPGDQSDDQSDCSIDKSDDAHRAARARRRFEARNARLLREREVKALRRRRRDDSGGTKDRKAEIAAAVARAKHKRRQRRHETD